MLIDPVPPNERKVNVGLERRDHISGDALIELAQVRRGEATALNHVKHDTDLSPLAKAKPV